MLSSLHIENYALIEKLDIDFFDGFSVITGETGAGKSIILGALGLILGQRADSKAIKEGANKCVIEGAFRIDNYRLQSFFSENDLDYADLSLIRREIYASGKSRSFINDTPATLQQLKELSDRLIDIHSQHQNLLITNASFQLEVVDSIANDKLQLEEYQQLFLDYKKQLQQLNLLRENAAQQKLERDYLSFQFNQLNEAHLREGEQGELEEELQLLSHAEEIKTELNKALWFIDNENGAALPPLKEALAALRRAEKPYPASLEWQQRLNSCIIDICDIANDISRAQESIEVNPARTEEVRQRLDVIYSLEQKHRIDSLEQLIELRHQLHEKLQKVDSLDEEIAQMEQLTQQLHDRLCVASEQLSEFRMSAFPVIESHLIRQLQLLGMPNVRFEVKREPRNELSINGNDEIQFLFSANKNVAMQPVAQMASGGEISRVMLGLKSLIASTRSLPTIIFDEIDLGISGEIANAMSLIMEKLGENMQVIAITHLPQIAARGKNHYKVFKDNRDDYPVTSIIQLTEKERINEIATMLSGDTVTSAAIDNAKQLLAK